jgi:2-octaprenyl-6-methoxyphenol hydroxylase
MADVIIIGNGVTGGTSPVPLLKGSRLQWWITKILMSSFLPMDALCSSQSSHTLFSTLGIWQTLTEITPITTIHTSDGVLPQWIEYNPEDVEGNPLGYVVDSALLKPKILEHVLSYKTINLQAPTAVARLERTSSHVLVETKEGKIFKAPLCIASDGRFSATRKQAHIPLISWEYDQTAIVCNMSHTLPHNNQAF